MSRNCCHSCRVNLERIIIRISLEPGTHFQGDTTRVMYMASEYGQFHHFHEELLMVRTIWRGVVFGVVIFPNRHRWRGYNWKPHHQKTKPDKPV